MSTETKWSPEFKGRILAALTRAGAVTACPRCAKRDFGLADGFANWGIQPSITLPMVFGGASIPVVLVFCTNCGFVAPHALGILSPDDLRAGT